MATPVSNQHFLNCIFGPDAPVTHVTDFMFDPGNIPADENLRSWSGGYFHNRNFQEGSNQYFTISHFDADDRGRPRRRKSLYRCTRVIVLDDVREKLPMHEVEKLPKPSWILETSSGSEQWGYILKTPCTDRAKIDNLLDGLVANGLAPGGTDPGMKGATRYVRLPEGYNTKPKRFIDGKPWKCVMLLWNPLRRVSLKDLANPFDVDLDAVRVEGATEGAGEMLDHPALDVPDVLHVKSTLSAGRYDVTCPWVDTHTDCEDNGTAFFTNGDSSLGFKCHHGHCLDKNGNDLVNYINENVSGFKNELNNWQVRRELKAAMAKTVKPKISFMGKAPVHSDNGQNTTDENRVDTIRVGDSIVIADINSNDTNEDQPLVEFFNELMRLHPGTPEKNQMAASMLKACEKINGIDRIQWHKQIITNMGWTKPEFKAILKDLKDEWYSGDDDEAVKIFGDCMMYVTEGNQFYNPSVDALYTTDSFVNSFVRYHPEPKKLALGPGGIPVVHTLDYVPKGPITFEKSGKMIGNTWSNDYENPGIKGNIKPWFAHFDKIGWGSHRKHIINWMAFTLQHPETKINHALVLGSREGSGKDWLIQPLIDGMGTHTKGIRGDQLTSTFNKYLLRTKLLIVNETETADNRDAVNVSNKLKEMSAAPPFTIDCEGKGKDPIAIRNIVNLILTTNSRNPIKLQDAARRYYVCWSDSVFKDIDGNLLEGWADYWDEMWDWLRSGGSDAVIYYLRNLNVDKFRAGAPPPVTDALRAMQDSGKSPLQVTIENFIKEGAHNFKNDLVTSRELMDSIALARLAHSPMIEVDEYMNITNIAVSKALANVHGAITKRCQHGGRQLIIWIIRNADAYVSLSSSELYLEYLKGERPTLTKADIMFKRDSK